MVDQQLEDPRWEWDDSIVLRRLVARAWVTLAGTSVPNLPNPAGETEP